MASEASICNLALGWIGGNLITSLDDETKEAQLCKANYPLLRDAVLEAADWSFAIKRFILPASATPPVTGYSHAYPLPPEVLRVILLSARRTQDYPAVPDWQVEGNEIVTDYDACYAKCVVQVDDPTKFSPLFVNALAARIAADLAVPVASSRQLQSDMWELYTTKKSEANTQNSKQGTAQHVRSNALKTARRSGGTIGPQV